MIKFTIYGEPVAQGRPRTAVIAGHARVYDPVKSRNYKQIIREEVLKQRPARLIEGPVSLTVRAYKLIPKSFSKAKRAAALAGELRPVTKPDLKNILAGVEDALNQVIWGDDSQVVDFGGSGKWYSDVPRVEVEIREIGEAAG